MKQIKLLPIFLALILIPCSFSQAWNAFRNEDGLHNANIVTANTPVDATNTYIKWQCRFTQTAGTTYNSSPIITDTNLYVVCEDVLYELDKKGAITRTLSLCGSMNSICHTTLNENRLYIPLRNGTMECVDISSMTSLWISESFGNQSLTTTLYQNGYIYAGTTHPNGSEGIYYCLDATDGSTIWTYSDANNPCGFYWSGACAFTTESQKGILFGGDNGILVSHSQTDSVVYDTLDLSTLTSSFGKLRSGITYDESTNCYYTTSMNGYLYKIQLQNDGTFGEIKTVFLGDTVTDTINCTSTPTIYNGRIYVGNFCGTSGGLHVIDANTMTRIYSATNPACGEIKASPLVSAGYGTTENNGKVYVYVTHNAFPGGLYYMEDSLTSTTGELKPLITPTVGQQFCLSSVVSDTDGTLYYSNDSGYLYAVAIGTPPVATTSPTATPTSLPTITSSPASEGNASTPTPEAGIKTKNKIPGKPTNLRYRIKKKKKNIYQITLRWKKGTNATKTCIQIKGKKKRFVKGKKAIVTLKKGKYTVRLTSYGSGKSMSKTVKKIIRVK